MKIFLIFMLSICESMNFLQAKEIMPPDHIVKSFERAAAQAKEIAEQWSQPKDIFDVKYKVGVDTDIHYQKDFYDFELGNNLEFKVLSSGELIAFQNNSLIMGEVCGLSTPDQKTWDEKKAIEYARIFIQQMLGRIPDNLDSGHASYLERKQIRNGVSGYTEGKWWVTFRRIDPASGYKFDALEGIQVYLYERRGPYGLYVRMSARFAEIDFTPLPELEITETAYGEAIKMTSHGQLADYFEGGHLLKDQAAAHLEIIKPNRFGETDIFAPTPVNLNARLAWVVWYPWQLNGQIVNPKNPPRGLAVWIDAQNKDFLGGNAFAK